VKFNETALQGAFVIELDKLTDERGFFARSYCQKEFEAHGLAPQVVQANVSYNHLAGTLRGMHYQVSPYEETKLIRCTRGALYDVIVDLRPDSPSYKKWFGIELTRDNYKMLTFPPASHTDSLRSKTILKPRILYRRRTRPVLNAVSGGMTLRSESSGRVLSK